MDHQEEYNQIMMNEGTNSQQRFRYITIAIVAFVLGFGSAWLSFKSQDEKVVHVEEDKGNRVSAVVEVPNDEEGNEVAGAPVGEVIISVDEQAPGKSVFVKEISSQKAVWVVIVEDIDGVHGSILGAGLFDVGETAGVVELLRGTVEGGSYYAVLYGEDSVLTQNRTFDLEKDVPLADSEGKVIEVKFQTSSVPE